MLLKKIILFIATLVILLTSNISLLFANTTNSTFDKHQWSLTKAQVINSEKSQLMVDNGSSLVYQTTIFNLKASLVYTFANDQLVEAKYFILTRFQANSDTTIKIFTELSNLIAKDHEQTFKNNIVWTDNYANNKSSPLDKDILLGYCFCYNRLESNDTIVIGRIERGSYGIDMSFSFYFKKFYTEIDDTKPLLLKK